MEREHAHGTVAAGQEIPLPGHYPCLTLQLNVTFYQSAQVGRMVAIVREPSDGLEVRRTHLSNRPCSRLSGEIVPIVQGLLADMMYLQDQPNEVQ